MTPETLRKLRAVGLLGGAALVVEACRRPTRTADTAATARNAEVLDALAGPFGRLPD